MKEGGEEDINNEEGGLINFGFVKFTWLQLGCQFCARLHKIRKGMSIG